MSAPNQHVEISEKIARKRETADRYRARAQDSAGFLVTAAGAVTAGLVFGDTSSLSGLSQALAVGEVALLAVSIGFLASAVHHARLGEVDDDTVLLDVAKSIVKTIRHRTRIGGFFAAVAAVGFVLLAASVVFTHPTEDRVRVVAVLNAPIPGLCNGPGLRIAASVSEADLQSGSSTHIALRIDDEHCPATMVAVLREHVVALVEGS